ncbi:MAG: GTP cyclohydrolase II [Xanthobacteraceae bacterium]|nr:MAG: GTP cyclohydrolase II [Xanthobacteraceae bacterium]
MCSTQSLQEAPRAKSVHFVASSKLPTRWGTYTAFAFVDDAGKEHLLLAMGDVANGEPMLARIHSECLTGDALFSLRCDCGHQLRSALARIGDEGRGVLLYLRQEGRGIGLHNKIRAYDLQDRGVDTVDANMWLGFDADARDYGICKPMLDHVGAHRLRLMTNNPAKMAAMRDLGIEVLERIALPVGRNPHNEAYLETKARRMGHLLEG